MADVAKPLIRSEMSIDVCDHDSVLKLFGHPEIIHNFTLVVRIIVS